MTDLYGPTPLTSGAVTDGGEPTPDQWFAYLEAQFRAIQRPRYCDGRDRPGQSLGYAGGFSRATCPRNVWLDTLWSYVEGDPPLPQVAPDYHEIFCNVLRRARANYAPMVVAPMVARMSLEAISTQPDSDSDGDDIAAEIMEECGFEAVSKDLFGYVFGLSEGYGMVVPGSADGPKLTVGPVAGEPVPMIHAIDPRRCYGEPDKVNPMRLRAALVKDEDPVTKTKISYLFLPGRKYELRQKYGTLNWEWVNKEKPEIVSGIDELGGIPIVRFDNFHNLGEFEPHIDLLDRIIDDVLQRIVGFWYQALRKQAVMGDEEEDDFDEQDSVVQDPAHRPKNRIDWDNLAVQAGPGALLKFPKDFTMWESAQLDGGPFINAKQSDVEELSSVTSTPLYLFSPNDAQSSALGAGLQREAATSKTRDRRARISPRMRLLWRMAFNMIGEAERGRKLKLHWGPIEFVTLIESAEASNQSQGTLSTEDRLERCFQMTPEQRALNMQRLTAEQLVADARAQAAATAQAKAAAQAAPQQGGSSSAAGPTNGQQPRGKPQTQSPARSTNGQATP